MATYVCERCGETIHTYVVCNFCNRKICNNCVKSSRRVSKTKLIYICKDCWTNTKTRKEYKSMTADLL